MKIEDTRKMQTTKYCQTLHKYFWYFLRYKITSKKTNFKVKWNYFELSMYHLKFKAMCLLLVILWLVWPTVFQSTYISTLSLRTNPNFHIGKTSTKLACIRRIIRKRKSKHHLRCVCTSLSFISDGAINHVWHHILYK